MGVSAIVAEERLWSGSPTLRIRGVLALHDPFHRAGRRLPTPGADPAAPNCSATVPWRLALQATLGDRCYSLPIDLDTSLGTFACLGNLTQSCCQPLPLGRSVVVDADVRVTVDEAGGHHAALAVRAACTE